MLPLLFSRYALPMLLACAAADAATLNGRVSIADGSKVADAFVVVRSEQRHVTYYVGTETSGNFSLTGLPAAAYSVHATAPGMVQAASIAVTLRGSKAVQLVLHAAPINWKDLTIAEWRRAFGDSAGRQEFEHNCFTCHGYQQEIGSAPRNATAWQAEMKHKRTDMAFWLSRMTDDQAAAIEAYLNREQSHFLAPLNESETTHYRETASAEAANARGLVFVEYDLTVASGVPWSANPDHKGNVWVPIYGRGNSVARLHVKDGAIKFFTISQQKIAGVHSVSPADDGTLWLTEFNLNRIAHLNPSTRKVDEYQVPGTTTDSRNSIQIAPNGIVWASGSPVASFDPKTTAFHPYIGTPKTYGLSVAANGDVWFTAVLDGSIGTVGHTDGQLRQWKLPVKGTPQHIEADEEGKVFLTDTAGGKILQFHRETGEFHDYPLPGTSPSPYALAIDQAHKVWYTSTNQDGIGCLDPETGKVEQYKFPHAEAFLRELKTDDSGRVWYVSPSNHVVGYFYPANTSVHSAANHNTPQTTSSKAQ